MAVKPRRKAVVVDVGGVKVGGDHPIVVQSMTNTDTVDVAGTVNQVMALARAGSELVRVTVNTEQAAAAVPKIVDTLDQFGVRVPIIGDFHYNGHILLKKYPECARALAKYRINPGNVEYRPEDRRQLPHHDRSGDRERQAGAHRRQLGLARCGAADPHDGRELQAAGAQGSARSDDGRDRRERHRIGAAPPSSYGLGRDRIILSAKVSGVQDLIDVYRALAARMRLSAAPGADRSRAWAARESSPPRPRSRRCCRKASATRSARR